MKKVAKVLMALILCLAINVSFGTNIVKADTFVTITLNYGTTVYSRQVYDVEIEQIKGGASDSASLNWIKETCNHVAFITQEATKIDSAAVVAAVKPQLMLSKNVSVNLSDYTEEAMAAKKAQTAIAAPAASAVVPVAPVTINPALMGFNLMLSSCTTKYTEGQSRSTNIKVAASRINGLVLAPGQGMSYSATILPRTRANGYTLGGTISNGQHIQSVGGGICQVSSTLNAAVLKAGIIPTERHNHSEAIGYLKRGLDATVSEGVLDYQFVNTLAYPIFISAVAEGGNLTIAIYSNGSSGIMYDAIVEGGSASNTTYIVGYLNGVPVSKIRAYSSKYK